MNRSSSLLLAFGLLVGACASSETAPAAGDTAAVTGGELESLPLVGGDPSWIACDDGALAITAYERRGSDGLSRPLTVTMFSGYLSLQGTSPDSVPSSDDAIPYEIDLTGKLGAGFKGKVAINFPKHTAQLTGTLSETEQSTRIDKTLRCRSLGRDFEPAAIEPNPNAIGDSASLRCESATVAASIFEHRNSAGNGRDTDLTLVASGHAIVAGQVPEDSNAVSLKTRTSAKSAFKGTADIDYAKDRLTLKGTYEIENLGSFKVDETIDCKRLARDF